MGNEFTGKQVLGIAAAVAFLAIGSVTVGMNADQAANLFGDTEQTSDLSFDGELDRIGAPADGWEDPFSSLSDYTTVASNASASNGELTGAQWDYEVTGATSLATQTKNLVAFFSVTDGALENTDIRLKEAASTEAVEELGDLTVYDYEAATDAGDLTSGQHFLSSETEDGVVTADAKGVDVEEGDYALVAETTFNSTYEAPAATNSDALYNLEIEGDSEADDPVEFASGTVNVAGQ